MSSSRKKRKLKGNRVDKCSSDLINCLNLGAEKWEGDPDEFLPTSYCKVSVSGLLDQVEQVERLRAACGPHLLPDSFTDLVNNLGGEPPSPPAE
jgi:hypothetical protein